MGNFEKLGILVIIVLVVVIIVVAAVGMDDPLPAKTSLAATSNVGGGGEPGPQDRVQPRPDRPDPPIRVDPQDNPTPVDPPVPPPVRAPRKCTVKNGDSLWSIAVKMYGANMGKHWTKIAAANPTVVTDPLQRGIELIIPDLAPSAESPAPVAADGRTYRIRSGDKLWNIARKTLGKGSRWPEIVAKNPGLNPDYLPVGKNIILPAR